MEVASLVRARVRGVSVLGVVEVVDVVVVVVAMGGVTVDPDEVATPTVSVLPLFVGVFVVTSVGRPMQ